MKRPNVPSVGPLGHQKGSTVSRRPKNSRADTKPQVWVSRRHKKHHADTIMRFWCPPCTGEGNFVHGRPILTTPCTVEPVFVHGELTRRVFGAKRPSLQASGVF